MREYKSYDEYKDSGIKWIGKIPRHWKTTKIKRLFHTKKEKSLKESPTVLSLTLNGLKVRDISNNEGQLASSYQGYHKVEPGDIVFNPMDLISGYVDCSKFNGVISPAYTILEKDSNVDIDENYFNKYFQYHYFNKIFFAFGSGVSFEHRWTLTDKNLKQIDIINPPKNEQQKIASFLDKKTAEIDEIINKKETLIDYLEKYKKSVITEAVTKGKLGDKYINQDGELVDEIEMKDSGVKWIGKIPDYWDVSKLKFLSNHDLQYGANSAGVVYKKGLPRYIRITDIKTGQKLYNNDKKSIPMEESKGFILKDGDLLFARSGATVGKSFIYNNKVGLAVFAGYLIRFRTDKEKSNPFFIYYFTQTKSYYDYINFVSIQATIENVSAEKYKNMVLTFPYKMIQNKIVDYLDKKTSQIDNLIQKTKKSIEKYKEYKKSLIFEAVTGKIDLRDYELEGGKELAEHNNSREVERKKLSEVN